MGRIKGKTSVNGLIPAEVASAALKNEDPAMALYNALSIKVKPENESEEDRKIRLMRRQFMFNIFGASADELEEILKKNKQMHENQGPSKSDLDVLRDSEDVATGQIESNKANKRTELPGKIGQGLTWGGTIVSVASSLGVESVTLPMIGSVALGPVGVTIAAVGLIISVGIAGIKWINKSKIKKGNKADANEKSRAYQEALEAFVKKVEIINEILTQKMDEIMEKKKTMKPEEFAEYRKGLIEEIKQHMKSIGLEVVAKDRGTDKLREIEEEKPLKPKPIKNGKEEKEEPKQENENPEKDENAEERGAE